MHPLKLPTLSQPKANILVHPCPPAKRKKINPHIPGTVAAKKIDPGTNAPTETPNSEPAKTYLTTLEYYTLDII